MPIVEMDAITKSYCGLQHSIHVLCGIHLRVSQGDFLCIMGKSGSGKSTLLNLIGCLDRPTSGTYRYDGLDVTQATSDELSRLRANSLGFIFQTYNLIDSLTVSQNVALPFLYQNVDPKVVRKRVDRAIAHVALSDRKQHRSVELSGGEIQRVAIARAIAVEPKVILADEPTGNLDAGTSEEIMLLFKSLNRSGCTIILVTHDAATASYADKCVTLHQGRIANDPL